jgi:hypothetical protein
MIPDWMKNAYTFASTPEEKATIMPVWDEVEECGSVYIEKISEGLGQHFTSHLDR